MAAMPSYPLIAARSLTVRESPGVAKPPRLPDRVRAAGRARHYSRRTEKTYVGRIRRYILFHSKWRPRSSPGT